MVELKQLPLLPATEATGYRLVNSKFPPIALFDDVADADEFEILYQLQARTNPRLLNEAGRIEQLPRNEIPFGITGCSYAVAPFTHINPAGSRFSAGSYGVLYLADAMPTALAEVRHHQQSYWQGVSGLEFERIVLRGLSCQFIQNGMADISGLPGQHPVYAPDDYSASRILGSAVKESGLPGLKYRSVRKGGQHCWALFTPKPVISVVQNSHYEMIWDGQRIASVNRLGEITDILG